MKRLARPGSKEPADPPSGSPAQRSNALEELLARVEKASTHYDVLGITTSAGAEEIKRAHLEAVTLLHPSHYPCGLPVTDRLLARVDGALNRVSESFSTLSNIAQRVDYDGSLDSRPKRQKRGLCIAASVTGYDRASGKWHEIARTVEVSRVGVSLRMRRKVACGCVLHLTLPLPVEFRQHSHSVPSYEMFAIVRGVELVTDSVADGGMLVELEFLGERPPVGYLTRPWAVFNVTQHIDRD